MVAVSPVATSTNGPRLGPATVAAILDFEAPYLFEKLKKDHIASSDEEARALFLEAKRYLIMCRQDQSRLWQMHSLRVDHVWHEFVLFTTEYIAFSMRFFGGYLEHAPSNAPPIAKLPGGFDPDALPEATRDEFRAYYERLFNEPLPDVWFDENSVHAHRRVINGRFGKMSVSRAGDRVELLALGIEGAPVVLVRVDEWATPALEFIAQTPAFYVRELPGELADEDRVALVRALVARGDLRVAT
ncbi:MAG TPA: hypothetical protein VGI39_29110 [Polyangiaceae bacterium]|jgi:hypothetical protein